MTILKNSLYILVAGLLFTGLLSLNAGPALSATKVGVTSAVNPKAFGTPPGGAISRLFLGEKIVFNHRIKTTAGGLVQLLFVDGSAFTVGENSELVIDKYIYDPKKKTGKMAVNVVKGVFRFVGGRLSKAKGGVTIKTSVATIGIRGGVMTGDVGRRGDKSIFSFLFGDEMVVGTRCSGGNTNLCSNIKRAFRNGNTIVVGPRGSLSLRPTTKADVTSVNISLAGRPGRNGGSSNPPTNRAVAGSNISIINSSNTPHHNAPPSKEAVRSTGVVQVETVLVEPEIATGDENLETVIGGTSTINFTSARALSSGNTYTISSLGNRVVNDPGRFGFVGADGVDSDEVLPLTVANGRILFTETLNGVTSTISAPFAPGNTVINAGDITETFSNGTTVGLDDTGRVFVAADQSFFLFELENLVENQGFRDLIVAFGGTPTPASALAGDGSLRTYTLARDFTQNSPVPLSLFNAVPGLANATVTDLLLKVQSNGTVGKYQSATSSRTVFLQGNLLIDGQGVNQKSYALVQAGEVFDAGNGPDVGYSLRGSLRQAANKGSAALTGGVDGLNGVNGPALFGPEGDFFVIGIDPQPSTDAFAIDFKDGFNSSFDVITDVYSTTQLAKLTNIAPIGNQATRTTRTLVGFAGGLQESNAGSAFPVIFQSVDDPNALNLNFNAQRNTLSAGFTLIDTNNDDFVTSYTLGFGSDATSGKTGAFIDDDRYGAQHNPVTTSIAFDNTATATYPNQIGQNNPNTYFFGNELVPTTGFVPAGVNICACKFLEWGYWGGRLRYQDPQGTTGQDRRDYFHLATWVAGNPTANLPVTGTATFNGFAIGNVAQTVGGQVEQFVAAGSYQQTWDFGSQTGTAQISNFAGRTFGSTNLTTPFNPGQFSGPVNGALTGQIAGTFVSDTGVPVAGVIGKFRVEDPADRTLFTAQGIIAAEITSATIAQ
jgi:trimeric autotransporter adhesin